MLMSVLNITAAMAFASETKKDLVKKSASNAQAMSIEVIDINGAVDYTDVVTTEDPTLDFDLESMPAGQYTIQVNSGTEVLNTTQVHNLTEDKNVITVEVLNSKGDKVYGSDTAGESFDLENMPKGEYVINIYSGQDLINTNKIVQLNELIVE